jgi:hypothetical protein
VTATGFKFQIDEWDYLNESHTTETVSWMVVEAGEHTLAGGTEIKAGKATVGTDLKSVSFASAFSAVPVVVSQVATVNEASAVCTRQQSIAAGGLDIKLQEEENPGSSGHAAETVCWVAISAGSGTVGELEFQASRTGDEVTQADRSIGFSHSFSSTPGFFAQMQTCDGGDTALVRYRSLGASSATVFVEEEKSGDSEIDHTTEVVGWLAIETGSFGGGSASPPSITAQP